VLLSGVNSGGKTSTLELLAQTVILAHMGFPVPSERCELGLVMNSTISGSPEARWTQGF